MVNTAKCKIMGLPQEVN